jgi:hypothetical protein
MFFEVLNFLLVNIFIEDYVATTVKAFIGTVGVVWGSPIIIKDL